MTSGSAELVQRWTILETYLSNKRYTHVIACPCGEHFTAYKHQINGSGKRCTACKGKCNRDGTYTAPEAK